MATEDGYIAKLNEWEAEVSKHVPGVLPDDLWHDGWNGAAGAEGRWEIYEPYPHSWDYDATWCRWRYATYYEDLPEGLSRPIDKIPGWIIRRAFPAFRGG